MAPLWLKAKSLSPGYAWAGRGPKQPQHTEPSHKATRAADKKESSLGNKFLIVMTDPHRPVVSCDRNYRSGWQGGLPENGLQRHSLSSLQQMSSAQGRPVNG